MSALLVGYTRCSTDQQDLTAQRDALLGLGVEAERIYVDHGLTGTNREHPGLREALAACRDAGASPCPHGFECPHGVPHMARLTPGVDLTGRAPLVPMIQAVGCEDDVMARLRGQRVVIRSLNFDDLEPLITGRASLAEQGNLADFPDQEQLRTRLPHWNKLRDGRVNLGIEVDGRLIGEIQTFQPADCPVDSGSAVCEVGMSIYDVADRRRGFGVGAMRLFVDWLFSQGVEQIEGSTAPANHAMRRVFERTGFTLADDAKGITQEAVRYRLGRSEM